MPSPTTLVSMISAHVLGLHPGVEDAVGPQDHDGALLAEAVAAGLDDGHLAGQLAFGQSRVDRLLQGHPPGGVAGGAGADADLPAGVVGQVGAFAGRDSGLARFDDGVQRRGHSRRLLLAQLADEPPGLVRPHAPEGLVVTQADHRGQRAGAHAVDGLQGEEPVGRGVAHGDLQFLAEGLEHQRRAGHVAGGAHAHVDDVLAHRLQTELAVEAGHPVDPGEVQVHLLGDHFQREAGQVAVGFLGGVHGFDQAGAGADAGDHRVEHLHVHRRQVGRRLLAHDAGRGRPAALARARRQGRRPGRLDVEGLLRELGAIFDLDAVDRAGALAQGAGVALVAAAGLAGQAQQALAAGLCPPTAGARSRCP